MGGDIEDTMVLGEGGVATAEVVVAVRLLEVGLLEVGVDRGDCEPVVFLLL